jgi:hypothetical protein
MVFGVAARRGAPVTVVPLDETRPPAAYAALEDLAATALRRGRGRRNNHTDVPG